MTLAHTCPIPEPAYVYAEELSTLYDRLPAECWDPIEQRRFVILRRRPIPTDDSMVGFVERWLDEEREQLTRRQARGLVQVIGRYLPVDPDPDAEDAKAEKRERRNR